MDWVLLGVLKASVLVERYLVGDAKAGAGSRMEPLGCFPCRSIYLGVWLPLPRVCYYHSM